jgi:outer membrane protein TolC
MKKSMKRRLIIGITPEAKMYNFEIAKKKAELQIIKRSLLPQFTRIQNYIWYGSVLRRSECPRKTSGAKFRFRHIGYLPLFEGFKSNAEIEKAKLEIDRLKTEKEKKLTELSMRHAKLVEMRQNNLKNFENQRDMTDKASEKVAMAERLSDQKLIEWVDFLTQKIELVNQKFELTRTRISNNATIKELQLLAGTGE